MNTFRIDLHTHSSFSADGCSDLEALTSAAKQRQLDAIAVTDHNLCTPLPHALNGVLLIPGCEISTGAGHITGLFLERPVDLESLGHLPTPEDAVAAIRGAGGIAALAHPFQRPGAEERHFSFALDAIETANARAGLKVANANALAEAFAGRRQLPRIGGSDAHHAGEIGNAFTEVRCGQLDLADLRRAILAGQTRPVLIRTTTHREKARSQWAKARKSGRLRPLLRGVAYWCYCVLLDLKKR